MEEVSRTVPLTREGFRGSPAVGIIIFGRGRVQHPDVDPPELKAGGADRERKPNLLCWL